MENKATPLIKQKQTWEKNEHPAYYSNIMQVATSPFDIGVVFGTVADATAKEITCVPEVRINLAPEQAANLIQMLMQAVQGYVKQFGPLRRTTLLQVPINERSATGAPKVPDVPKN